jgi:ligand-binding sensor domain-containing protein
LNLQADQSLTIYKQISGLQPALSSPSDYRISGLAFDENQNLWIANDGAFQNLVVRKRDGSWQRFTVPFPLSHRVSQIVVDDVNQKWIIAPGGNGLLCFNHGQSIENTADDKWKWYRVGKGEGNLPGNHVLYIVKDRNGFIWVGTTQGIGVIQCPQEVFTPSSCDAVLPVVQQDNFAGFLFRDQQVQAVAVDGADRKWIGTQNGVWLITADGQKIIHRFSESIVLCHLMM